MSRKLVNILSLLSVAWCSFELGLVSVKLFLAPEKPTPYVEVPKCNDGYIITAVGLLTLWSNIGLSLSAYDKTPINKRLRFIRLWIVGAVFRLIGDLALVIFEPRVSTMYFLVHFGFQIFCIGAVALYQEKLQTRREQRARQRYETLWIIFYM